MILLLQLMGVDMSNIYLCNPYCHPDPKVKEYRFKMANVMAAYLMTQGHTVFSPISHSVPINRHLPDSCDTHEFWMKQDLPLVEWCDEVYINALDGWTESKGVGIEYEYAKKLGKPIKTIEFQDKRIITLFNG